MTIKELRQSTGMTQTEFGDYLNIPMRTIQNWEGEKRKCPEYVTELIKYKINKEEIGMRNDFDSIRWGDLNEREQSYLLSEASPIDGTTGNKPKESVECIIDLASGYSVFGHVEFGEFDEITIEDDAVIYKSNS